MPYDSTRVSLKDGMDGDYINASFVNVSGNNNFLWINFHCPVPHSDGNSLFGNHQ